MPLYIDLDHGRKMEVTRSVHHPSVPTSSDDLVTEATAVVDTIPSDTTASAMVGYAVRCVYIDSLYLSSML